MTAPAPAPTARGPGRSDIGMFRLLWLGTAVSLLGDGVYLVALAWQAYSLSPHPQSLAILGVCATVPQLLALLGGGLLSDRMDRRHILLAADAVRFLAVGAVAILALAGHARMWHLIVLSVVYGLGAGVAAPAFDALVPQLVPDTDLERANALEQFLRPAALRLGGPALGGFLIAAVGVGYGLAVDAASFLVSAVCIVTMGGCAAAPLTATRSAEQSLWADARTGARYVAGHVWLWGTFASAAVAYLMFIGPTEVLLPYLVRETMHGSATDFGVILAAGGTGALAAAAVVGATGLPRRQLSFMYVTWSTATLAVAGYAYARTGWELMAVCMVINGLEAAGTIAWATTKQRLVPGELMGRVSSLDWFISIAGLPLSYALTAPAAAIFGVRATFTGAGVIGAACTLAALFLPGMRDVDGALATPSTSAPKYETA